MATEAANSASRGEVRKEKHKITGVMETLGLPPTNTGQTADTARGLERKGGGVRGRERDRQTERKKRKTRKRASVRAYDEC